MGGDWSTTALTDRSPTGVPTSRRTGCGAEVTICPAAVRLLLRIEAALVHFAAR